MRVFLENEELFASFDTHGAELKSVVSKSDEREYMWYGDSKYWNRTSPVLFPFVGSLKDKIFSWEGKNYPMGQHGFARDMEFTVTEMTRDEIWFELQSDEVTMSKYPFAFSLEIGYRLSKRTLHVKWRVKNKDTKKMYFSIGAHPAFLCPVNNEESFEGYKLKFDNVDKLVHHGNTRDTGLSLDEHIEMSLDGGKITLTEDFFDRCTYFFEGRQTDRVTVYTPQDMPVVSVKFDTPLFALWSPEGKHAPFICIEPWYGRCDAVNFTGDLSKREYTNDLDPDEIFSAEYRITYYEV